MIDIVSFRNRKENRDNLLCFPYAGGGANYFKPWLQHLPDWINLHAVRLPGRETLFSHVAYTSLDDILFELSKILDSLFGINQNIFLFGHSMGALIAFEVTHFLLKKNIKSLFISGYGHPTYLRKQKRHLLTNLGLKKISYFPELEKNSHMNEFLELIMPTLRSDYAVCDTYTYIQKNKLNIPILVFGGKRDLLHTPVMMDHWQIETNSIFQSHYYAGGHFFIREHYLNVLDKIQEHIMLHKVQSFN